MIQTRQESLLRLKLFVHATCSGTSGLYMGTASDCKQAGNCYLSNWDVTQGGGYRQWCVPFSACTASVPTESKEVAYLARCVWDALLFP